MAKGKQKPRKSALVTRKKAAPPAKRKASRPAAAPAKPAAKKSAPGRSWLDPRSHTPLINQYARRLGSFMAAMADGKVEETELEEQEARLVELMKQVEPRLNADLHEKVTQLLCELTAYDIMQMLHSIQSQRPHTVFQG